MNIHINRIKRRVRVTKQQLFASRKRNILTSFVGLLGLLLLLCGLIGFQKHQELVRKQKLLEAKVASINLLPKTAKGVTRKTLAEQKYTITTASSSRVDNQVTFTTGKTKVGITSLASSSLGDVNPVVAEQQGDKTIYQNIYNGINLIYTRSANRLLEEFEVNAPRTITEVVQKIDMSGSTYEKQADGSIIVYDKDTRKFAYAIPRPVMYEKNDNRARSYGLHYEIVEYKGNTFLLKVIDAAGQEWMKHAAYPLMIDATIDLTLSSFSSYPEIDGKWVVRVDTVGVGTLGIDADNGASLDSLTCGGKDVPVSKDSTHSSSNNFSCSDEALATFSVGSGKHTATFTYSGLSTTVETPDYAGKPVVLAANLAPAVVKIGDTITVSAEVLDEAGVKSVTADMGGVETIDLNQESGSATHGNWKGTWKVHNTSTKPYQTTLTVMNSSGAKTTSQIAFFDPYTCTGGGDHAGADWIPATDCPSGFAGVHTNIGNFSVASSTTATVTAFDGSNYGVATISASTVTVAGTLTADGKGYAGGSGSGIDGSGPGGGQGSTTWAPGGGYGGAGVVGTRGGNPGQPYGSLTNPIDLGSGGGGGPGTGVAGYGGGVISITATGIASVSGTITTNGTAPTGSSQGGAGSGGSIYLSASGLTGAGAIRANGGSGTTSCCDGGGGGGGGRVAVYVPTASNTYTGSVTASAGRNSYWNVYAEAGTAFIEDTTMHDITIPSDNGKWNATDRASWTFRNLTINGSVTFRAQNASLLTITTTGTTIFGNATQTVTLISSYTTNTNGKGIYLNLAGNVTIPSTTTITTDGTGYAGGGTGVSGSGTGGGGSVPWGTGGGYGGAGGVGTQGGTPGSAYGSLTAPTDLGSGGGGGNSGGANTGATGGGAIRMTVGGTLTVAGIISANGAISTTQGGGGAGGSIYIKTNALAGAGTIRANGGNGSQSCCDGGGGGGGGRIAVYVPTASNTYTGSVTVTPGQNIHWGNYGEAGTAFIEDTTTRDMTIPSNNGTWLDTDITNSYHNLTINGSIAFKPTQAQTMVVAASGTTTIAAGITITAKTYSSTNTNGTGVNFRFTGDVTIPATTTITSDGWGYPGGGVNSAGSGSGAGVSSGGGGGGAGYGGAGGNATSGASGGATYGSSSLPTDLGSGGGGSNNGTGGYGGGIVRMSTTGTLTISGTVSAKGGGATGQNAGGGSGGSILLAADTLAGAGTLTANGGNGSTACCSSGGKGGGGRIALHYVTATSFSGTNSEAVGTTGSGSPGVGTFVATQVNTPTISSFGQYRSDCSTAIPTGGSVEGGLSGATVCFKGTLSDTETPQVLQFELETKPVGTNFDGFSATQSATMAFSGTPVTGSISIPGNTLGVSYHWRMRAIDQYGITSAWTSYGGNTESDTDYLSTIPAATNVHATYNSDSSLTVTWTDNASGEDGYIVERSDDGGSYVNVSGTLPANTVSFTDNAANDPTHTPVANKKYDYRVYATVSGANSLATSAPSIYTTPAAPSGASSVQSAVGSITITWTDNADYESYFEIQRQKDGGSFTTVTATVANNATTYTDTTVHEAGAYVYKVRAIRNTPDSLQSAFSTAGSVTLSSNGDGKGVFLSADGRLFVQNDFKKSVDVWTKIDSDASDQTGSDVTYSASLPTNGPHLPTGATINNLTVKEGASEADGKSDVLYVGTDKGVAAIHENHPIPAYGAVKLYTRDYVSELMQGDARGMWPLESNFGSGLSDTTNHAEILTNNGGVTFTSSGIRGHAGSFNGSTQYLSISDDATLSVTGKLTVGAWFKTTSPSTAQTILSKNGSYSVGITAGGVLTGSVIGTTTGTVTGATSLDTNWHHVMMVYDPSNVSLSLYLDGQLDSSTTSSVPSVLTDSSGAFQIGADNGASLFTGLIDEPFVSSSVYSAGQARLIYTTGYKAQQNHTASRITGITDPDSYQKLLGSGASGATVNNATSVAVDDANQFLFVGTNDTTATTGGVSTVAISSDSVVDLYDTTNNTTKVDDNSNQFAAPDVVALSVAGNPNPSYTPSGDNPGSGGLIVIAGTNDTATRVWLERQNYSLGDVLGTAAQGGSTGQTATITDLLRVGSLYTNRSSSSGEVLLTPAFEVNQQGRITANYLGIDDNATAFSFSDANQTTGTTFGITSSAITSGNALSITANALTSGNALNISSSTSSLSGALVNIAHTGVLDGTGYGQRIAMSGTGGTNVGLSVSATGGTANYAALFTNGSVGIGTSTPVGLFNVNGALPGKALTILNQLGDQDILAASTSGTTKFRINNSGQIYLSDGVAPGTTTNMLYATGGSLYWAGSIISGNPWMTSGATAYYNSGNVAIGTTTPIGLFTLSGTNGGSALAVLNQTGSQAIFTASSSGMTKFIIDNGGNVGIGSVSPANKLVVSYQSSMTNPTTSSNLQLGSDSVTFSAGSDTAVNGQIYFPGSGNAHGYLSYLPKASDNNPYFRIAGQGTNYGDRNVGLVLSGNLGVGTTIPKSRFQVANNVYTGNLDGYDKYQILLYDSGTGASSYGMGIEGGTLAFNSGGGAYKFYTGGSTVRLAINTNGNVGVGTTNAAALFSVGATSQFQVNSTGNIFSSAYSTNGGILYASNSGQLLLSAAGTTGQCLASGGAGAPSWTTCSPWSTNGSDAYYTSGNVGIGTSAPTEALTINGNLKLFNTVAGHAELGTNGNLTKTWTSTADFNASGVAFTSGMQNPATNNQLNLKPNVGNGADGAVTFSSNTNINTANTISGRSCADGGDAVNYSVTALTSTTATLASTPSAGCLSVGDVVLLINQQGTATSTTNVGNYELLTIQSISTNTITFTSSKTKFYGDGASDDTNIGTATTNQRVMLQRVPQYSSATINTGVTLNANAWNGTKGGVLFFRVSGTFTNNGTINMDSKGYRGTAVVAATPGNQGESIDGVGSRTNAANLGAGGGGGGAGGSCTTDAGVGGGGAYATTGTAASGSLATAGAQGATYGSADLQKIYLGSAGGAGTSGYSGMGAGPVSGSGGGVIMIGAVTISGSGTITANGGNGYQGFKGGCYDDAGSGAGSGGSIALIATSVSSLTITGSGGTTTADSNTGAKAGTGGDGRVAIFSTGTNSATATPTAYTSTVFSSNGVATYSSGTQSWTSETVDAGAGNTYRIGRLTASWTDETSDIIHPKFQVLGSNTGSFSGEETVYPAGSGTYYQSGGTYDISSGVAKDITAQVTNSFRYWKVKAYMDTGTTLTDTPVIADIKIEDTNYQALALQASGGNVGVGTTAPSLRLHVKDSQAATSSALIENADTGTTSSALALKLGAVSPALTNNFMTFLNGNGEVIGKITGNGSNGVSYATSGSDVAEYFEKANHDEVMSAGDTVCLAATGGVTKCTDLEQNVIGVISDRAGFVGGVNHAGDPSYVLVGLMGQLPVHVASDSAQIVVGDSLTISGRPGELTKGNEKGIVARSLQIYDPSTATDNTIMAYVSYAPVSPNAFAVQTNYSTDPTLLKTLAALEVDKLTVNKELMVLGKTTVTDLGVTGNITTGILAIHGDEGTINALGTLKLQSNGYGNIELFAGKVDIDNKGNIMTQGVLGAKKIQIDESDPESSSIGSVVIKAGNLTVTVTTSALTDKSHIFATPDHPVLYGVKKAAADSFTVSVPQKQSQDVKFDWWIIN